MVVEPRRATRLLQPVLSCATSKGAKVFMYTSPPCILKSFKLGLGLAAVTMMACSNPPATTPETSDSPIQLNQAVTFQNAVIGEGLFVLTKVINSNLSAYQSGDMTGEVCVSVESGVTTVTDDVGFSAFTVFDEVYIEPRYSQHLEGSIEYEQYENEILNHYEPYFLSGEEEIVTILATIPTSTQSLPERPPVGLESACDPNGTAEARESLEEFFNRCGHRFLREQERAIVIAMSAQIDGLSHEEKVLLDRILSINLDGQNANLDEAMLRMNIDLPNVHFRVTALTEEVNPNEPLEPNSTYLVNGALPPAKWPDYRDQLKGYYISPFTGEVNDPSFGEVVNQEFEDYSPEFFEACGNDVPANLICYYQYVREVEDFYREGNRYSRLADEISWLLNNDARVKWTPSRPFDDPNGEVSEQNTRQRYELFESQLSQCNTLILTPGRYEECHVALLEGLDTCPNNNNNTTCYAGACQYLEENYNQLPPARILPEPTPNPTVEEVQVTQDEPAIGSDATANLCVLSSVSGNFAGLGEAASLTYNGGEWLLDIDSQRTESTERIIAGQFCVPTSYFQDTTSFTEFLQETFYEETNTSYTTNIGSARYAAAINGITGHLEGGGEYALINRSQGDTPEMTLATQQGTIGTWASAFGTLNPLNDQAQLAVGPLYSLTYWEVRTESMGHVEKILAPVDEGVCYLTKIQGNFDGGGERVSINQVERNWVLSINAGCQKRKGVFGGGDCKEWKDVRASARCYKYDQQ